MLLKWFHVREYQSVRDSGRIGVGEITCLVGKNEAGKSALLRALYRLNPIVEAEGNFNVTHDYPRMEVEDYRHAVEAEERDVAIPIEAVYALDKTERAKVEALFGPHCLERDPALRLSKNYENKRTFFLACNTDKALAHVVRNAEFSDPVRTALGAVPPTADALITSLQGHEQTEEVRRVTSLLEGIKKRGVSGYIFDTIIVEPKFLYFDEYYQMTGHENIESLVQREASKQLLPSDHPLLGLVRLARLYLQQLLNPDSTIELKNKLQGASNHLSKQVLRYWSQNRHLRMEFDVRPARPGDPAGMQKGTNLWGGVFDTRHQVTTELGSRSRGFVWFFSFLAWYSDVRRTSGPLILLLDEPGLTLHAKAQGDLLRYFEEELKGNHQLIYSTHSPFMIDPEHFERVRVVQDKSIDVEGQVDIGESGTKVLADIFSANPDSLFPLQGALGYELHQTLFVGPNNLVVEGAADLLYIQAMSSLLHGEKRVGLDPRWTVTPVGGSAKVPTFVALLGAQRNMRIATLVDSQVADKDRIHNLYREKLLKKANVFTFGDFVGSDEADIEDMFGEVFYVDLVNAEFKKELGAPLKLTKLGTKHPRIVRRIEEFLETHPLKQGQFGHFRPARYFTENLTALGPKIPAEAKDRFEAAFSALNSLLPTQ